MKRYNPGDPLRIPAADLNLVADFVEGVTPGMSSPGMGGGLPPSVVRVRNATGSSLAAFSVVAIGEPRVLPSSNAEAFKRFPVFTATVPAADATVGLAILQRTIPNGETGLAIVAGGSPVRVTVTDADHMYAAPDGSGGLVSVESGPISLPWKAAVGDSQWCFAVIGAASGGSGSGDCYQGYFKLSISEKTRQVENPDYDPEDPESEEYIDEIYYEAHHSGGRYTVNGQVGSMLAGDVEGDLSSTLQDVILHYHYNSGEGENLTPTGVTMELSPLGNNSLTDAYWLIGQASVDAVVQQSHGVPALLWFGCRDGSDESVSEDSISEESVSEESEA